MHEATSTGLEEVAHFRALHCSDNLRWALLCACILSAVSILDYRGSTSGLGGGAGRGSGLGALMTQPWRKHRQKKYLWHLSPETGVYDIEHSDQSTTVGDWSECLISKTFLLGTPNAADQRQLIATDEICLVNNYGDFPRGVNVYPGTPLRQT